MPIFKPDTCLCALQYDINEADEVINEVLLESCGLHTTFNETIEFNRLKNTSINAIQELIDMNEKEIGWSVDEGIITLTLYGFTEEDITAIEELELPITIVEG